MLVKRLIIDGRIVLAIQFDNDTEENAIREMAGRSSKERLNEFMRDLKTASQANNILVAIMFALDEHKRT